MSRELLENGPMNVTAFWGGKDRGPCIQFTPQPNGEYAQANIAEVREIVRVLYQWLAEKDAHKNPNIEGIVGL